MNHVRNILLVDDDAHDVELTTQVLRRHNFVNTVDVAHDGEEALDYLHRRGAFAQRTTDDPVVVLLDIKMPKIDGVEVLHHMKTDAALKAIPVVMLTSSREDRDLERCYALGVNAYVVKPVGFPEFTRAVSELGIFWALVNEPPPQCRP